MILNLQITRLEKIYHKIYSQVPPIEPPRPAKPVYRWCKSLKPPAELCDHQRGFKGLHKHTDLLRVIGKEN